MHAHALDLYADAFRARSNAAPERVRVLVTDDSGFDRLAERLPAIRPGMVVVAPAATRCLDLLHSDASWTAEVTTAMIHRDLRELAPAPLPEGLALRRVRRLAGDAPGVPLKDAVAVAMAADPRPGHPDAFADYLRSLPPAFRVFAAVAADGTVQATSAAGVFGGYANVMFVNTHPTVQRRGIGSAMTLAALEAARDEGATQAVLDASPAGASIYRRLGLETAAELTRFFRA